MKFYPLAILILILALCSCTSKSNTTPTPTITTPTSTPVIQRGTPDPDITVDIYDSASACIGTTILPDNHNLSRPRIIEVNMLGEILWQYVIPQNLIQFTNPGFDVEPLPNDNILFVLPRNGVYEIDRSGNIVWSYLTAQISHDADRLPNGNTLFAFGAMDTVNDAQVKEINPRGEIVWSWHAKDYFNKAPYNSISAEGWTHTNAVSRLSNGNTLISLRNFNFVVEVNTTGAIVRTIGEGILTQNHDPAVLASGNILVADHCEPQRVIELDAQGQIVWQFSVPKQLVRDANRLANGNTLITGSSALIEVTKQGKIVWQLKLTTPITDKTEGATRGFYKAERISTDCQSP